MQIVSNGDNLHEMSKLVFWEKKKNISICCLLKILPRVLSIKDMRCNVRKHTFWHVHPMNSNQPAHPHSLIRVFAVCMKKLCILGYPKCLIRLCKNCANAQADLNLHLVHTSKGMRVVQ